MTPFQVKGSQSAQFEFGAIFEVLCVNQKTEEKACVKDLKNNNKERNKILYASKNGRYTKLFMREK